MQAAPPGAQGTALSGELQGSLARFELSKVEAPALLSAAVRFPRLRRNLGTRSVSHTSRRDSCHAIAGSLQGRFAHAYLGGCAADWQWLFMRVYTRMGHGWAVTRVRGFTGNHAKVGETGRQIVWLVVRSGFSRGQDQGVVSSTAVARSGGSSCGWRVEKCLRGEVFP